MGRNLGIKSILSVLSFTRHATISDSCLFSHFPLQMAALLPQWKANSEEKQRGKSLQDGLCCYHRKWMLDYRNGNASRRRSCRKKKGRRKMPSNPKGLYFRVHYQANKATPVSILPSLKLSFLLSYSQAAESLYCSPSVLRAKVLGYSEKWTMRSLPGRVGSVPSPRLHSSLVMRYFLLCRL